MAHGRVLWFPERVSRLRSHSKRARIVETLEVILQRAHETEEFYMDTLESRLVRA